MNVIMDWFKYHFARQPGEGDEPVTEALPKLAPWTTAQQREFLADIDRQAHDAKASAHSSDAPKGSGDR